MARRVVPVLASGFALVLVLAVSAGATTQRAHSCGTLGSGRSKPAVDPFFTRAKVVFIGIALDGPGSETVLYSPASFQVVRYLKGHGGPTLRVATATTQTGPNSGVVEAEGISPRVGELWLIFSSASDRRGVLLTSGCASSMKL